MTETNWDIVVGLQEYLTAFFKKFARGEADQDDGALFLQSDELWKPVAEMVKHRETIAKLLAHTLEADIDDQLKVRGLGKNPMRGDVNLSFRSGIEVFHAQVVLVVYADPEDKA